MKFLSKEMSPTYVMKLAMQTVVETNTGNVVVNKKWGVLKFHPFQGGVGFETNIMPSKAGKQGYAYGILDSGFAAQELRDAGHTFRDKSGEDVTEQELIKYLKAHVDHGVTIGCVDEEVQSEDEFAIITTAAGSRYCRLCDQHMASHGVPQHINSKKHQGNLEDALARRDVALAV